jgi:uncharacterized membrane protein
MDFKKLKVRIYAILTITVLVAFVILIFTDNSIVKMIRTVLLVIWAPWTLVTSFKAEILAKDIEKKYPVFYSKWVKFKQQLNF